MKKIYITTAIALASIAFAGAQESRGDVRGQTQNGVSVMRQMMGQFGVNMMPQIITGDATVDAQIKALNKEAEVKIKAIRDDYQVKVEAIIKSKFPQQEASTTPRGMMQGEKRGFDEGRKMGVPFNGGTTTRPMMGTTTRPMMNVRYVEQQTETKSPVNFMDMIRGFFGGNKN